MNASESKPRLKAVLRLTLWAFQAVTASSLPLSIQSFVVPAPNFENCLLHYIMKNYLPYCMCGDKEFRDLCYSLNRKCRTFSRAKLQCMFKEEYIIY